MRNLRDDAFIWIQVLLIIVLWIFSMILFASGLTIGWDSVRVIPEVVTGYTFVVFAFTKWAWRWNVFAGWLVPLPDLEGTWRGSIAHSAVDSTNTESLQAILVIRQTFSTISCVVYTAEAESHSGAAALESVEENGVTRLSYIYLNRPRVAVRHRSEMHDGAALMTYSTAPHKTLSGEYWTSRRTMGELSFHYQGRYLTTQFEAARWT